MSAPFFGPVKATVSAVSGGTGALTPSTASTGYLAFSTVPSNTLLFIRTEEGTAWETAYSLWDGTTLTRVLADSSTGSLVTFTTAATVAIVPDPNEVAPHLGGGKWAHWAATANSTNDTAIGAPGSVGATGTQAASALANTNYLTMQVRKKETSATTASAVAQFRENTTLVYRSTTAFRGGFDLRMRFGASTLPTNPRAMFGLANGAWSGTDPNGLLNCAFIGCIEADAGVLKFYTNDGSGNATAQASTGMTLTANAFYEVRIWCAPGASTIYAMLRDLTTGAIWIGSATTDLPASGVSMFWTCGMALNATNTGTAVVLEWQHTYLRSSF